MQRYSIGDALHTSAVHHESFEKLWETKWKRPCEQGIYPFMFGCIQDFEPVAQAIIKKGLKEPYDWDEYAEMFFSKAEELANIAANAEAVGKKEKASEYYLSALYRIARFPIPRSEKQRLAWTKGKEVFYKGSAPILELHLPHIHRLSHEGHTIPTNLLIPSTATPSTPVPLLIILTGLDGYRTELAVWQQGFHDKGVATLVLEIPGTGDSPADPQDPTSPDRIADSVFAWIDTKPEISKVIVWGFSTGGFYATRMAYTHASRLAGAVSLGGGAHRMFDPEWLNAVDRLEYPFDLRGALAVKFGYGEDVDEFVKKAQEKFSLLVDGTCKPGSGKECCRLLVVNGEGDEIFPVEDARVAVAGLEEQGRREIVVVKGRKHMGEPESFVIILKWIHGVLGLDGDYGYHFKMLPTKVKY
ncbi:hypothetical protein N0V88_003851 [Collariella sp. IMI 366227]|nr:hypothetical protein N0V88_003851 [Collariella sp. IMI 366227]